MGIAKEKIENFAIQAIKDTLLDKTTIDKVQENLQLLLDTQPSRKFEELRLIQDALEENERRTRRITDAIEKGGELSVLLGRLKDLSEEHSELEKKLNAIHGDSNRPIDPVKVSQEVARFYLNFESKFEQAPMDKKKEMMKKCISEILIDRNSNVARFFIRIVPAATLEIEEIFKKTVSPRLL